MLVAVPGWACRILPPCWSVRMMAFRTVLTRPPNIASWIGSMMAWGRAILLLLGLRHVELPRLVELIRDPDPCLHRFLFCHGGIPCAAQRRNRSLSAQIAAGWPREGSATKRVFISGT